MKKLILLSILLSSYIFAFSTDDAVVIKPEEKNVVPGISNKINLAKLKKEIIKKSENIKKTNKKILTIDTNNSNKKDVEKKIISFVNSNKNSNFGTPDDTIAFVDNVVVEKYIPKKYKGVKFFKKYNKLSVLKFTFKDALKDRSLSLDKWKNKYLNNISTEDSIFMNAIYYDKKLHNPSIAEDFYLKLKDINNGSLFKTRLVLADYLLRTGRIRKIDSMLNPMRCIANFKLKNTCFYYKGLSVYAKTGDNRNRFLRSAKDSFKIAKRLYYKK